MLSSRQLLKPGGRRGLGGAVAGEDDDATSSLSLGLSLRPETASCIDDKSDGTDLQLILQALQSMTWGQEVQISKSVASDMGIWV